MYVKTSALSDISYSSICSYLHVAFKKIYGLRKSSLCWKKMNLVHGIFVTSPSALLKYPSFTLGFWDCTYSCYSSCDADFFLYCAMRFKANMNRTEWRMSVDKCHLVTTVSMAEYSSDRVISWNPKHVGVTESVSFVQKKTNSTWIQILTCYHMNAVTPVES